MASTGKPAAIRLASSEWEMTGEVKGLGSLLNALERLAIYSAASLLPSPTIAWLGLA